MSGWVMSLYHYKILNDDAEMVKLRCRFTNMKNFYPVKGGMDRRIATEWMDRLKSVN